MNLDGLLDWCAGTPLQDWSRELPGVCRKALSAQGHGDWARWSKALTELPDIGGAALDVHAGAVRIGSDTTLSCADAERLRSALMAMAPWRKGPFELQGVSIDTEWRSDWKWNRLQGKISPLANRAVLDVGCGNGYYLARMWAEGARIAVGIDPTILFAAQYLAWRRYCPDANIYYIPVGIDHLPAEARQFDTVFSMGVIYHRRSPIDHLLHLKRLLRPGGELVLEGLTVPGDANQVLVPQGRYARMRNVWFLPSAAALQGWLQRCGYTDVTLVDETPTTTAEQRATDWMTFQSLADALDGEVTVEGHPPPTRAILTARA